MRTILLCILVFLSKSVRAEGLNTMQLPVYIDLSAMAGEVSTTGGPTGTRANTLYAGGIGFTLALNFSGFLLGGLIEYQNLAQAGAVDTGTGNYSGSRILPAPMIGALFDPILVKIDYQIRGNWVMSNLTTNGASMQFTDPTGYRISVSYLLFSSFFLGLQYENVSFTTLNRSDTGSTALTQKLTATDINMMVSYAF